MDAKLRFYIVNLEDGSVRGTNNDEFAEDSDTCDEYLVIDTENVMLGDGTGGWYGILECGQDYVSESEE